MPGRLILCATPIGNLDDASPRLRASLESADVVYAEDTRKAKRLLGELGVSRRTRSYFVGNEAERSLELGKRLEEGASVAFITDAGTPALSDPGLTAVRAAVAVGADVTVVPGASAVTAALAVAGLPAERFVFEGFLPRKGAARRSIIESLSHEQRTMVLFASPRRLAEDLADLAAALGDERSVVVARELTKRYEEIWRGTLGEAARHWGLGEPKGEVTLVVAGGTGRDPNMADALAAVEAAVAGGLPLAEAVRQVAETTGTRRRRLYEAALRRSD